VVLFSDARSESPFESIARVTFSEAELPPPALQVWVGSDDYVIGRVDFLWREHRTVAEADGALKYADPERARMQLGRDAELREAGYEVVHFTWRQLQVAPGEVIRSIRVAFERAAALDAGAAFGTAALGTAAFGTAAFGTAALGTAALGTAALGTAAAQGWLTGGADFRPGPSGQLVAG
jgi:hypothetical protein